jgi:UDP-N-acetylglucosamine transferase subunit ALG13
MLFLCVGTQLPFDRLVKAIDDWAGSHASVPVVGQIGATDYRPQNMSWAPFMTPDVFSDNLSRCEFVVAHAGMGIVISALESGKPIIVLPRKSFLNEHRNDHQIATCERLGHLDGLWVARSEGELVSKLDKREELTAGSGASLNVDLPLLQFVRSFVAEPQIAA